MVDGAVSTLLCFCYGLTTYEQNNSGEGGTFTFPATFYNIKTLVTSISGIVSSSPSASSFVESGIVSTSTYRVKILVISSSGIFASTSNLGFYAIATGLWK